MYIYLIMSDFLQLTDAGSLYPRQFSSSLFGRQESSILYEEGPMLTNQEMLMRQSSIDALFAPDNPSEIFFETPSMAESMNQTSIYETSTDYTYKQPFNQYEHQHSNLRHCYPQAYFSDDPSQIPMLPHTLASSASSTLAHSPSREYESSNVHFQQPIYEPFVRKTELLAQIPSATSRELTASNSLPQLPRPNVKFQFDYADVDSSEVDDSEFEFSPITPRRQVWSTLIHRGTLADGTHYMRQRSSSGGLQFSAHQQAMVTAWSIEQAKLVELPPLMSQPSPRRHDGSSEFHSGISAGDSSRSSVETSPKKFVPERTTVSLAAQSTDKFKSATLPSHYLLPPSVDPDEIVVGTYSRAERAAKISRYREKRARRQWTKKII